MIKLTSNKLNIIKILLLEKQEYNIINVYCYGDIIMSQCISSSTENNLYIVQNKNIINENDIKIINNKNNIIIIVDNGMSEYESNESYYKVLEGILLYKYNASLQIIERIINKLKQYSENHIDIIYKILLTDNYKVSKITTKKKKLINLILSNNITFYELFQVNFRNKDNVFEENMKIYIEYYGKDKPDLKLAITLSRTEMI